MEKILFYYILILVHQNKNSNKNRTRLPLQPSTQQSPLTSATISPSTSTIRQPKKHKLFEE